MLFFIDESKQTVGGTRVGALGGVAIPDRNYNRVNRAFFGMKRDLLGATELNHHELKGNDVFAKATFRWTGPRNLLHEAVDGSLDILRENDGRVFSVWTERADLLTLRTADAADLTMPYQDILSRCAQFMMGRSLDDPGLLFFDQIGHKEDLRAACAVQNFMVRTTSRWVFDSHFVQAAHYTHSAVSPGLQMADLIAYLGAQQTDPVHRPELGPWFDKFRALAVTGRQFGPSLSTVGAMVDPVPILYMKKRRRGSRRRPLRADRRAEP